MTDKIIFFDTKEEEKIFFEQNTISNIDYIFYNYSLNKFFDDFQDFSSVKAISIFTTSQPDNLILDKFENLQLIALRSVGFNHIDLEYCRSRNITVVNAAHYGDITVAEFTFGLMLDVMRHISEAYSDMKQQEINISQYRGQELYGKTLGIIGLGAIGGEVARIANGFHMNILAVDRMEREYCRKLYNVCYTSLDELAEKSDIITIHAPSTTENYHMINANFFSKMKPTAFLINTARGEIVDAKPLYDAILYKQIKGAALDVVEYEEMMGGIDEYVSNIDEADFEALKRTVINNNLFKFSNIL